MNKKKLLIFEFLLIIPLVFAQLVYQQDSYVDLKLPCSYNGSFCDTATASCNGSISYPNGSVMMDNINLTLNNNGFANLTVRDTSIIGIYQGYYSCCQLGDCDSDTFEYEITNSGFRGVESGEGTVIIGSIIVILIVSILFYKKMLLHLVHI